MANSKPLSPKEVAILEEIDAFIRAGIRNTTMNYCSLCSVEGFSTGEDVEKVLNSLKRRGFLEMWARKWLRLTELAEKAITRSTVIHFYDRNNVKLDKHRKPCTDRKPCGECRKAAARIIIKQAVSA